MNAPNAHRIPRGLLLASLLALLIANAGCSQKLRDKMVENQPPTVRLTHAPVSPSSRENYAYKMNWIGYDPDGRIDYFLWAKDPKDLDNPDTNWVRTTKNEETIEFSAGTPDEPVSQISATAAAPHIFAIRAVDNRGMSSATVYRAFFATTVAPVVRIDNPSPSLNFEPQVTPSVRISWSGQDVDGPTGRPVSYRYRLFGLHNPDFAGPEWSGQIKDNFINWATNSANADSFRKLYAPEFGPSDHCPTCTAWSVSPADTTETQYSNLVPQTQYLFIVTGFDQAGAYDPVFRRDKNMLLFNVSFAGSNGPKITLYNEFFYYSYISGGFVNDASHQILIEAPAGDKITFNWFAEPPPGASIRRYRWVLDLEDLSDETPRENLSDWYHWSAWSLTTTSAQVGPFNPPRGQTETHFFFLEAEDNNGLVSLGIVNFTVVTATFDKDVLFVQDCRFIPDQLTSISPPVLKPPSGAWPNKSEIDTFFYARGGNPYKLYPAGTLSPPGIFNGYNFDTTSVRLWQNGVLSLKTLGKYKYVVWYTDKSSAALIAPPYNGNTGLVMLRNMTNAGQPNTLAILIKQGGSVWMFGGGAAAATLLEHNKPGTLKDEYNAANLELVPGRFVYDFPHWQSQVIINRRTERARLMWSIPDPIKGGIKFNATSPMRSPNTYFGHNIPPYADLAANALTLTARDRNNPLDDPPPLRRPDSGWYTTQYDCEYVDIGNFIVEDTNGDGIEDASMLDTIYITEGTLVDKPVMTYYHGLGFQTWDPDSSKLDAGGRFVFSGFPLWFFSKPQQIALVDFVLHGIFGLERNPSAPRFTTGAAIARSSAASVGTAGTMAPRRNPAAPAGRSTPQRTSLPSRSFPTPGARR
jgi:hypothetical protein